jgi:hypothetical protein
MQELFTLKVRFVNLNLHRKYDSPQNIDYVLYIPRNIDKYKFAVALEKKERGNT